MYFNESVRALLSCWGDSARTPRYCVGYACWSHWCLKAQVTIIVIRAGCSPGVRYYPQFESSDFFANDLDVILFAVSILSFEDVLRSIPPDELSGKLVVDVLSVKIHAKQILLGALPPSADIL